MLTITTTYPEFYLETYLPRAHIEQKVTQIKIEGSGPEMQIDQKQSRNELGIGDYDFLSKQIRDKNYQKTLEAIARMAQEGDDVVNRAGKFREEMVFAHQAKKRIEEQFSELNIRAAPSTRPKIDFHYEQQITWEEGGALITHYLRPPKIFWNLGGVKVDVRG